MNSYQKQKLADDKKDQQKKARQLADAKEDVQTTDTSPKKPRA